MAPGKKDIRCFINYRGTRRIPDLLQKDTLHQQNFLVVSFEFDLVAEKFEKICKMKQLRTFQLATPASLATVQAYKESMVQASNFSYLFAR